MVPIPTGESILVQKWNSCGVLGRRSVATTRPRIGDSEGSGIEERRVASDERRALAHVNAGARAPHARLSSLVARHSSLVYSIARNACSASRTPYTILSHRPSGRLSGVTS